MEPPQSSGKSTRSRMACLTPVTISSWVKGSPAKYFSMNSSEVSATCSLMLSM